MLKQEQTLENFITASLLFKQFISFKVSKKVLLKERTCLYEK